MDPSGAAEAPALLDARVPGAAALGEADREALRLAQSEPRDAVGEATTKLDADFGLPRCTPADGVPLAAPRGAPHFWL
jgi:hypothetical protein